MASDEELMKRVALGDSDALAGLLERHSSRVHGYLVRYTHSRTDADDLLQETWIRVARSARQFDSGRRFRTWLYGIATNLGRDFPAPPRHAAASTSRREEWARADGTF